MTLFPARTLVVGLLLVSSLPLPSLFAQAVSDLPRAEYYVARELYGAGRTIDAASGFEASLSVARRIGEVRWVDSIPPLVMLGECYYQQGNLALALEQYDAALALALAHPNWIDQIEVGTEQLPLLENVSKGPNWFPRTQASVPVAIPEGVQLSIDPTQAQAGPGGTIIAPVSLVTRLDATEILKTLGIAMMRRNEILGPLVKHSAMSIPLEQLFARQPRQQALWVLASWQVLHGISVSSLPTGVDAPQKLRSGVLIQGKFDYFMSPLALLALGKRDANEGKYQAAIANLQEATLLAAFFEQHVLLAESLQVLSSCAAASSRGDLIEPLQQAATWSAKRSPLSQLAAMLGAAELSIYAGRYPQAEKLLNQSNLGLRSRDIALPRMQAQSAYIAALANFGQDRGSLGVSNLDTALKLMHGSAQTGAVVERVFQAQQTLDLFADGRLTALDSENLLTELLAEPTPLEWQNEPLKTLATITTASVAAFERWLQLAIGTQDDAVLLARMDRVQRQRLYEALPLGGRLFCWRAAATADPQNLPAEVRAVIQAMNQRSPRLTSVPTQMRDMVATLKKGPLPLDERQLTAELRKAFTQLETLSGSYENLLMFHSLSRTPMHRYLPAPVSIEKVQETLADGDLAISLVAAGRQLCGAAISRDQVQLWQVADSGVVSDKLALLLKETGVNRPQAGSSPLAATGPTAAWKQTAADLEQLLFPAEIQERITTATRVILAPNGQLWYVPFELLPEQANAGNNPWLASRTITYIPTLGALAFAFSPPAGKLAETVGLVDAFFSLNKDENAAQADALASGIANTTKILLTQKNSVPSAHWLRIRADQVWVASRIESRAGWDAIALPVGKRPAPLGSWVQTPQVSPAHVLLPGFESSIRDPQLGNGDDLLLSGCAILYGGSRAGILSRWSTGGKSSGRVLLRCLEELRHQPPSSALQRAVLALWTEDFLTADEPALLPAGKDAAALTSGQHPLLWSGYMCFGDSAP